MELEIYEKFHSLIPPLQQCEYRQLEENILQDGCATPLDIWLHDGKKIIVDGHNRYKICKYHGVDFQVHEMQFDSYDDATIWIIRNQFGRRNLSNFQKAELALVLEPLIAAKAKERQAEAGGDRKSESAKSLRENSREAIDKGRTDETLAQISNVSSNTIRRAKIIKDHGTPEQIERARTGGRGNSVNAIYTEIKHRDIKEKTCPMCKKTLPINRFYGEGATCKTCTEIRKQTLLSGGTVSYANPPEKEQKREIGRNLKRSEMKDTIRSVSESLRDAEREVEHTPDDLSEALQLLTDDFIAKVRRSIEIYKEDFGVSDGQIVRKILGEFMAEIRKIMEAEK